MNIVSAKPHMIDLHCWVDVFQWFSIVFATNLQELLPCTGMMMLPCQIEASSSNGPSRNGGRPDMDGILFGRSDKVLAASMEVIQVLCSENAAQT